MCTEVNSVMGLQATAATKRKHEITFDGKEANTYTNCSPPMKISKWSKNNSLVDAIEDKIIHSKYVSSTDESVALKSGTTNCNRNFKSCSNGPVSAASSEIMSTRKHITTTATTSITTNGIDIPKATGKLTECGVQSSASITPLAPTSIMSSVDSASSTTPLPPTSTAPIHEDSIAKLEEVAAAHCESWHPSTEPVDCISKLQAVAVPSDPWGSISTRSTLATTLLSADEIDDDDDDFEDDYEEEESIIPTYCPLRYHPFSATSSPLQQRATNYSPTTHGYGTRPNYYSEPFPQQNCSRTGSPHHLRMSNGGGGSGLAFPQWQGSGGNGGSSTQQFYVTPSEVEYSPQPQQQQQQTIRCAENGKSYLDLGCSTPTTSNPSNEVLTSTPPGNLYSNLHVASALEAARHPLKRCCEGRGTWCNANKNCYKDIRLKIRNLSMFKLSRFRQVSEQSLYRSVLICNTLKYIDREIEAEAKEIHQAAHAHAHGQHHAQHTQYHHPHHPPHQMQPNHHNQLLHHSPPPPHQPQLQQQQPQLTQLSSQPHLHQQHQDYSPVLSCARVSNLDYQVLQHQPPQQQQHFQHQNHTPQPLHPHHYHNSESLSSLPYISTNQQMQVQQKSTMAATATTSFSPINGTNTSCDSASSTTTPATSSTLHPYDHYPFRESQSGRATPFPAQPVIPATPQLSPASTIATTTLQLLTSSAAAVTVAPTLTSIAPTPSSPPPSASAVTTISTALTDADSGYGDDDCTRSINWSSVLSLSSQSALDPLNNNELFSIIPTPPTAVTKVTQPNVSCQVAHTESSGSSSAVAISGSFTTVQAATAATTAGSNNISLTSISSSPSRMFCSNNSSGCSSNNATTTTATFTTLSTISSATYSMTSSFASSLSSAATAASVTNPASTWEYGFLDMDFGLGSEFTELMPSCKLSSEDLFKNGLTPVATSRYSSVHDNELEQPAHIMVGS